MVVKKDSGTRMCVDFRKVNLHVITDRHPLPRIDQILEELGDAVYLTALDLLHSFYNLKINPKDRWKTVFSTPDGHYKFIRLPMGLKNSPAIFQRAMNLLLQGALGQYAYIYMDDIIIYSRDADSHLKHIETILEKLQTNGLKVKFSKCQLFREEIAYIGFLVSLNGMKVNPEKLNAVTHFPQPENVPGIQAFLGLVGYFHHFITNFADKAKALYRLLKKEMKFSWTSQQEEAFNLLKNALVHAPVLAFPNFDKEFILTIDASGYAIGALLTQVSDENPKAEKLIRDRKSVV